jgi:hypothetical protein
MIRYRVSRLAMNDHVLSYALRARQSWREPLDERSSWPNQPFQAAARSRPRLNGIALGDTQPGW